MKYDIRSSLNTQPLISLQTKSCQNAQNSKNRVIDPRRLAVQPMSPGPSSRKHKSGYNTMRHLATREVPSSGSFAGT